MATFSFSLDRSSRSEFPIFFGTEFMERISHFLWLGVQGANFPFSLARSSRSEFSVFFGTEVKQRISHFLWHGVQGANFPFSLVQMATFPYSLVRCSRADECSAERDVELIGALLGLLMGSQGCIDRGMLIGLIGRKVRSPDS